jgi:divalent metal cation (Fe/Co/Zn/Cd) transporter
VSFHLLVPDFWTVQHGHHLSECIEDDIRKVMPNVHIITHLESLNDPASWKDIALDREDISMKPSDNLDDEIAE